MAQLPAKQDQYVKYAEKDSKGRNIAEEIDKIADMLTKPVYWHTIKFQRGGNEQFGVGISRVIGYMIVLNDSPTPLTLTDFQNLLDTPGFIGVVINGKGDSVGATNLQGLSQLLTIEYSTSVPPRAKCIVRDSTSNVEGDFTIDFTNGWVVFQDLGANRIN